LDETTGWYYPLYNVTDASGNVLGITEDIKLIPNFTSKTRTYKVTIYNTDGEEILMPTTDVDAGTLLSVLAANIKPTIEDEGLSPTETYRFIGYRTKLDTRTIVDIKHEAIDTNTNYYATYEVVPVYDNVDWDNFIVSTGAIYEEYIADENTPIPMARLSYLDGSTAMQENLDWINPTALGRDNA
jgi:hypothetical protein